jgi:MFS family permease
MTQPSKVSDSVVLVLGLAVLLNYVDRANLATAAPVLQDELSLSASQMGLLLSAFFWAYAPAQLVSGWLVHRFDIRAVMACGLALWALATAATGAAAGFASILVLRLILGLGESVIFPSWQLILARGTAEHERGRANGLIGAGQGVGPMLGTLFGGLAIAHFGWRPMFVGLGVITISWLWPWYTVTRGRHFDMREEHNWPAISYATILRQREFWGSAAGHFSINYAFYFVMTWLPTFLVKAGGLSMSQMALVGAAIYGVYAVSTAVAGTVSDRWIRAGASATRVRKAFSLASGVGAAATIACSMFVEPRMAVWLLGGAGISFGLSTPTMFAMTGTLAGPRAAGRWAGAQNVAGQMAGIIAPIVTGVIVDRTGSFSGAFAVSAVFALIAALAWGVVIRRVEPVQWEEVPLTPVAAPSLA